MVYAEIRELSDKILYIWKVVVSVERPYLIIAFADFKELYW
jgi:hypothetical protein